MSFFQFQDPAFLFLLVLVPVIAFLLGQRGPDASVRFSSASLVRAVSRSSRSNAGRILLGLRLLALTALIFALARPQFGESTSSIESDGIDIVVTLDLSYSMKALDLSTRENVVTRLDAAKKVVDEFIAERSFDRIGLIAFGSDSFVVSPLTLNHQWLKKNLDRLELGEIDGSSTAIGTALAASVNRLKNHDAESRIVILLTDGENNAGSISPKTAADAAKTFGVKVYTIATGRQGRVPVPRMTRDGQIVRDRGGSPVFTGAYANSSYNEEELKAIATTTGGRFYKATEAGDLERIYEEIDALEKTEVELQSHASYTELFMWPAAFALIVFAIEQLLANTRFRRLP